MTRHRARRREASARRDHSQLDLVHFEFDESHACGLRWRKRARGILRGTVFVAEKSERTERRKRADTRYRKVHRPADCGEYKIESSESSLRKPSISQGRCANELAPSVTVILQSPSAPFARRWTEQPRPRGARDVRVALESRPASVAPREVPAGDSKPPRAPALDKIPPCRPSRLRRASPRPEARASAETENTPRGAARRPAPRRAPRFARLSPVPGTTRAFP